MLAGPLLAPNLLGDTKFLDDLRSVLIVTRQTLSRARLTQPPLRDLVLKSMKAQDRNGHGTATAGQRSNHEITSATRTAPLENRFAGFEFKTARPSLEPAVITPLQRLVIHRLHLP
jgi:hypothetical protein